MASVAVQLWRCYPVSICADLHHLISGAPREDSCEVKALEAPCSHVGIVYTLARKASWLVAFTYALAVKSL